MNQEDFNKKLQKGEVEMPKEQQLPREVVEALAKKPEESRNPFADYAAIIEALRKVKPFRTSAPTNVPKSFIEAIEFYDTGGVRRVYFYINKTWRYVTLT